MGIPHPINVFALLVSLLLAGCTPKDFKPPHTTSDTGHSNTGTPTGMSTDKDTENSDTDENGDCPEGTSPIYADKDGDRVGSGESLRCDRRAGFGESKIPGDCDDGDASVHPYTGDDLNDGVDSDCNGLVDDDEPLCGIDRDGDGFSPTEERVVMRISSRSHDHCIEQFYVPEWKLDERLDCDDDAFWGNLSNPDTEEFFFDVGLEAGEEDDIGQIDASLTRDENCDGLYMGYIDLDNDGRGTEIGLGDLENLARFGGDCDDNDPEVFLDRYERDRTDGKNNDCDSSGAIDEADCAFMLYTGPNNNPDVEVIVQMHFELDQGLAPGQNEKTIPEQVSQWKGFTTPFPNEDWMLNPVYNGDIVDLNNMPSLIKAKPNESGGAMFSVPLPGNGSSNVIIPPKFAYIRQLAVDADGRATHQEAELWLHYSQHPTLPPNRPMQNPGLVLYCGCKFGAVNGCLDGSDPDGVIQFYTCPNAPNPFNGWELCYQTDEDPNLEE